MGKSFANVEKYFVIQIYIINFKEEKVPILEQCNVRYFVQVATLDGGRPFIVMVASVMVVVMVNLVVICK